MQPPPDIGTDAVVIRHVPGGDYFQQPPSQRITSSNFQLRPDELGVSVTLSNCVSLREDGRRLFARLKTTRGSRLAYAAVTAIRQIGFEVKRSPTKDDPNHALILSNTASLHSHRDRKLLATKFRYIDNLNEP